MSASSGMLTQWHHRIASGCFFSSLLMRVSLLRWDEPIPADEHTRGGQRAGGITRRKDEDVCASLEIARLRRVQGDDGNVRGNDDRLRGGGVAILVCERDRRSTRLR